MVGDASAADSRVARLSPQITAFSAGYRKSNRPRRVKFESQRGSEPRITDPAILRRTDVLGTVGEELRKSDAVAAAENMPADTDSEDRIRRPGNPQSHIVTRAEAFLDLGHGNRI